MVNTGNKDDIDASLPILDLIVYDYDILRNPLGFVSNTMRVKGYVITHYSGLKNDEIGINVEDTRVLMVADCWLEWCNLRLGMPVLMSEHFLLEQNLMKFIEVWAFEYYKTGKVRAPKSGPMKLVIRIM